MSAPGDYPSLPVLVVDDEQETLDGCEWILRAGGISNIRTCVDSRDVMGMVHSQEMSVVVLDLSMPHVSGYELLERLVMDFPRIPVIILTGMNQVEAAVKCMRMGAFDYMVKPVEESRMLGGVQRAVELREERREYEAFRKKVLDDELDHPEAFSGIVTCNKAMRSIFQYVETIAVTGKPVLITGESGVGKDLVARAVHRLSGRKGEFVPVNTAGLDDNLFSDTLFGHLKGSFTHAESMRQGLLRKAAGGTLFLDEIGELSNTSQLKLLRVLQGGEYYPVGADAPVAADVRIISATNLDPTDLEQGRRFRTDLYFRIQTHHVHIPPLRKRPDDLALLLEHFLEKAALALGKKKPSPPRELLSLLAGYSFPGNVRELESMVFDAVSHHKNRMLSMDRFRARIHRHAGAEENHPAGGDAPTPYALVEPLPTLRDAPRLLLVEAMRRSNGNKDKAANMLRITRSGLNKALKRNGLGEQ